MANNLVEIIEQFKKRKVLVVGEAMLDRYLSGNASRLCREAPAPIVDIQNLTEFPGGAANTAVNVARLGGKVSFLSLVGEDGEGKVLTEIMSGQGVDTTGILTDNSRRTLIKQRIAAGGQILVRFDYGSTADVNGKTEQKIVRSLESLYSRFDAVIISDYGYGFVTRRTIETLKELQARHRKILMVDSKYADKYKDVGPTIIKPNFQEAVALLGITRQAVLGKRIEQIAPHGKKILELTGAEIAAVTSDIEGSIVFRKGREPYRTYAVPMQHSRAIGSGDTYVSAFTLALACFVDAATAAELAAAAATVVVQKEGTATCSNQELQFYFSVFNKHLQSLRQLKLLTEQYRSLGKKIVFTNGCFDILHSGHVQYLSGAKGSGDVLMVGLNSDESIRRLKGAQRPVNSLSDRIQVLSALSSVDHIVSFSEDTPVNLIKIIKPDVYVKGGDYTKEQLPEAPVVEGLGGKVKILPFVSGYSTTSLINRIKQISKDGL